MPRPRHRTVRRLAGARPVAVAVIGVVALAAVVAACSRGEAAPTTTERRPTTTTTTTAPPPGPGPGGRPAGATPESPPEVAWITQVGGPGADALRSVAARNVEVSAVGGTDVGLQGPSLGGLDALAVVVRTPDGSVVTTHQLGSAGDDVARSVSAVPSGNAALACGETTGGLGPGPVGTVDLWCAPLGPDGAFGRPVQTGSDSPEALGGVALDSDGTWAYLAGSTTGVFPGAADPTGGQLGGEDALVARLDPDGDPVWARQFGSGGRDVATGATAAADGDGIAVGSTDGRVDGIPPQRTDGWVARFDPSGAQRWYRPLVTAGDDVPLAVAPGGEAARATETFVVVGRTDGPDTGAAPGGGAVVDPARGGSDVWVVAVDSVGQARWVRRLGSPGDDEARAVAVDGATVLVAATVTGPVEGAEAAVVPDGAPATVPGGRDGVLVALDLATGETRWIMQFGTAADEEVTGVTTTEDGLAVVVGTTGGQLAATPPGGSTDGFLLAVPLPAGGGAAGAVV